MNRLTEISVDVVSEFCKHIKMPYCNCRVIQKAVVYSLVPCGERLMFHSGGTVEVHGRRLLQYTSGYVK